MLLKNKPKFMSTFLRVLTSKGRNIDRQNI